MSNIDIVVRKRYTIETKISYRPEDRRKYRYYSVVEGLDRTNDFRASRGGYNTYYIAARFFSFLARNAVLKELIRGEQKTVYENTKEYK